MEKILCFLVLAVCTISNASVINYQPKSRISGGTNSMENQFQYAVSLQQRNQVGTLTRGHTCGGVLITSQHVLTSARCTFTYGGPSPVPIVPSAYRVFAGSVSLLNDSSSEHYRMIVNVTRHPEYIGHPAFINDIAILTLDNPFNTTVATPLSIPPESFVPAEDAQCVVVGWGSENANSIASITQRYARKYISSQDVCRLQYNLIVGGPNILPSMLCALPFDNLSVGCDGDFGNGLVCNGGLAGILSITNGCVATSYPEVYTRVSNYSRWIRSVTGGASTFQPGLAVLVMFTVVQLLTAKIIS